MQAVSGKAASSKHPGLIQNKLPQPCFINSNFIEQRAQQTLLWNYNLEYSKQNLTGEHSVWT